MMSILLATSKKDRYHDAIISAFTTLHRHYEKLKFKEIYYHVCLNLGASDEQAKSGLAICPYTSQVKCHKGLIRSWIEERSPHSRQHYFRAGKRVFWKQGDRPLLFINEGLAEQNEKVAWEPYKTVRGDGWIFNPIKPNKYTKPSEEILMAAANKYLKVGMRGAARTIAYTNTTTQYIVNPTSVTVHTF
jgi:hypothetical protein